MADEVYDGVSIATLDLTLRDLATAVARFVRVQRATLSTFNSGNMLILG